MIARKQAVTRKIGQEPRSDTRSLAAPAVTVRSRRWTATQYVIELVRRLIAPADVQQAACQRLLAFKRAARMQQLIDTKRDIAAADAVHNQAVVLNLHVSLM